LPDGQISCAILMAAGRKRAAKSGRRRVRGKTIFASAFKPIRSVASVRTKIYIYEYQK